MKRCIVRVFVLFLGKLFVLALIVMLLMKAAMAGGRGSLRGVAINQDADPLPNAIVELFADDSWECKYSGKTDSKGAFQINDIPEGIYFLEIKAARIPTFNLYNIRIEAGRERNLRYKRLGLDKPIDCSEPGVHCQISLLRPADLRCAEDVKLLHGSDDKLERISRIGCLMFMAASSGSPISSC